MGLSSSRSKSQLVLASIVLVVLKCGSQIHAHDKDFAVSNEINGNLETLEEYGPNELLTKEKVEEISNTLAKLLLIPWPKGATPLVYIEKPENDKEDLRNEDFDEVRTNDFNQNRINDFDDEEIMRPISPKRSKYYRKYPWKRQQNSRYEPSYMCAPKKDDVYRLLIALHGERNGKRGQLIDFCNRKRPASLVFTNIRFVG